MTALPYLRALRAVAGVKVAFGTSVRKVRNLFKCYYRAVRLFRPTRRLLTALPPLPPLPPLPTPARSPKPRPPPNQDSAKRQASPLSPSSLQVAKQQRVRVGSSSSASSPVSDTSAAPTLNSNLCSTMSYDMPDYFKAFLETFKEARAEQKEAIDHVRAQQNEILSEMSAISDRVSAIEQRVDARISVVTDQVAEIRSEVSAIRASAQLTDTCELLITGVPAQLLQSNISIFASIVSALGLPTLASQVIDTRPWTPASVATLNRTEVATSSATQADTEILDCTLSSEAQPRPTTIQPTRARAFVVRLASSVTRDLLISKSPLLAKMTVTQIFGEGGKGVVFIRPLWPKPVHSLWQKALIKCRAMGYQRPFIRNLNVFTRLERASVPIHIASEEALDALLPSSTASGTNAITPRANSS